MIWPNTLTNSPYVSLLSFLLLSHKIFSTYSLLTEAARGSLCTEQHGFHCSTRFTPLSSALTLLENQDLFRPGNCTRILSNHTAEVMHGVLSITKKVHRYLVSLLF